MTDVVCYQEIAQLVIRTISDQSFNLIEFLAAHISHIVASHTVLDSVLDLDILAWGHEVNSTEDLIIPHQALIQRPFLMQLMAKWHYPATDSTYSGLCLDEILHRHVKTEKQHTKCHKDLFYLGILNGNWNDYIDVEDQVFFLGDFGLGDVDHLLSICSQLKDHKICIRGNHDRNASYMMRGGFRIVLESAFLKIGQYTVLFKSLTFK